MSNWWDPITGFIYNTGQQITQPIVTPIVNTLQSNPATATVQPVTQQPTQQQPVQPVQPVQQQQPQTPAGKINQVLSAPLNAVTGSVDVTYGLLMKSWGMEGLFPQEVATYQKAVQPVTQAFRSAMPLNEAQYETYKQKMINDQFSYTDVPQVISHLAFGVGDIVYQDTGRVAELGVQGTTIWAAWETGAIGLTEYGATSLIGSGAARTVGSVMSNPMVQRSLVAASFGASTYVNTEGFSKPPGGNVVGVGKSIGEFTFASAPLTITAFAGPSVIRGTESGYKSIKGFGEGYKKDIKWGILEESIKYAPKSDITPPPERPWYSDFGPNDLEIYSGPGGAAKLMYKPKSEQVWVGKTKYMNGRMKRWNGKTWEDISFYNRGGETILMEKPVSQYRGSSTKTPNKIKNPLDTQQPTSSITGLGTPTIVGLGTPTTTGLDTPVTTPIITGLITPTTTTIVPGVPIVEQPTTIVPGIPEPPTTKVPGVPEPPTTIIPGIPQNGGGIFFPPFGGGGGFGGYEPPLRRRAIKWKRSNRVFADLYGKYGGTKSGFAKRLFGKGPFG